MHLLILVRIALISNLCCLELKPFVECSIVQRIIPHSNVKQFKYLKMLTQEFHVKVDLLFINEIAEMFTAELTDEEKVRMQLKKVFTSKVVGLNQLTDIHTIHVRILMFQSRCYSCFSENCSTKIYSSIVKRCRRLCSANRRRTRRISTINCI